MPDISLYYGYNPYYPHSFTNANGKIRNLVWEELVDPVEGKLLAVNPLVNCLRLDFHIFFNYGLGIRVRVWNNQDYVHILGHGEKLILVH